MATRASADIVATLRDVGIIPVVRARSADAAVRVAETLVEAGIPVAEITLTVPDAVGVIGTVARRFAGRMLVAAGTVTDADAARRAIDAGAEVVVTPCLVPEVIAAARAVIPSSRARTLPGTRAR
jgi:2-dehydro-3-deoxyphosphogluconate aldolase/(4S)-4-hydroxy-2-oxoglutarate aldolase